MANVCEFCGKRTRSGNKVSHAHNKSKRQFKANLKNKTIIKNNKKIKIKVCTRCIKSGRLLQVS
ncbi:MAG TPA: 50S ribosomal protein L28 [Spirochaetota bacterium]|nr:50S ribosomal protein L28 [Spirochaetota bacterium]